MARTLKRYQQGGGNEQQAMMQKIVAYIQQSLQSGATPDMVAADLVKQGLPPEGVMQIFIQMGMPQDQAMAAVQAGMQGGSAQQQGAPQQQMMEGPMGQEESAEMPMQRMGGNARSSYSGTYDAGTGSYYAGGGSIDSYAYDPYSTMMAMGGTPPLYRAALGGRPNPQDYKGYNEYKEADNDWLVSSNNALGVPAGSPRQVLDNVLNGGPGDGRPVNDTIPANMFDYNYTKQFQKKSDTPKASNKQPAVKQAPAPVIKVPAPAPVIVQPPVPDTLTTNTPDSTINPFAGLNELDSAVLAEQIRLGLKPDPRKGKNTNTDSTKTPNVIIEPGTNKDPDCVSACAKKFPPNDPNFQIAYQQCIAGCQDKAGDADGSNFFLDFIRNHPVALIVGAGIYAGLRVIKGNKIKKNITRLTERELQNIKVTDGEALLRMAEEYKNPEKILELAARDYRGNFVTRDEMSILKNAAKKDKKLAKKMEKLKVFEERDPDLPKEFYQQLHLQDLKGDGLTANESWVKEINPENIQSIEAYLDRLREQASEIDLAVQKRGYVTGEDVKKAGELQMSAEKIKMYIGQSNPNWWDGTLKAIGGDLKAPFRLVKSIGKYAYKKGTAGKYTSEYRLAKPNKMKSIFGWNTLYEYGQVGKEIITTGKNKGKYKNQQFQEIVDGYVQATGKQPANNTEILDFYNQSLESNQRNPLVKSIEKTLGIRHVQEKTGNLVKRNTTKKPKPAAPDQQVITQSEADELNSQAERSGNRTKYWENFLTRAKTLTGRGVRGVGNTLIKGVMNYYAGPGFKAMVGYGSANIAAAKYYEAKAKGEDASLAQELLISTVEFNPDIATETDALTKEQMLQRASELRESSTLGKLKTTGSLFLNLGKSVFNGMKPKTKETDFEKMPTIEQLIPKFKKGDWVSEAFEKNKGADPVQVAMDIVNYIKNELIPGAANQKEIDEYNDLLDREVSRMTRIAVLSDSSDVSDYTKADESFDWATDPYSLTSKYHGTPEVTPKENIELQVAQAQSRFENAKTSGTTEDILFEYNWLQRTKAKLKRFNELASMPGVDISRSIGDVFPEDFPDWDMQRSIDFSNNLRAFHEQEFATTGNPESKLYLEDPITFLQNQADQYAKQAEQAERAGDLTTAETAKASANQLTESLRKQTLAMGSAQTTPEVTPEVVTETPEVMPLVVPPDINVEPAPIIPEAAVTAETVTGPITPEPVVETPPPTKRGRPAGSTNKSKQTTTEQKPLTVDEKIERAKQQRGKRTNAGKTVTQEVPKPTTVEVKNLDVEGMTKPGEATDIETGETKGKGKGRKGGRGKGQINLAYGGYIPDYSMAYGGGYNNPGFKALPAYVQENIMRRSNKAMYGMGMAEGGQMPQWLAQRRFAAAGNQDKMSSYGYENGGVVEVTPEQLPAMLQKLRQGGYNFEIID